MYPIGRLSSLIGGDDLVTFPQGKLAMASRWMSSAPVYGRAASQIGMVPYPKGPGPNARYATDLGPWGVSISRTTKHLDAAWRYVSYITGPKGAALDAQHPGRTPARPVGLSWLPSNVINPEIYGDLLDAGTVRVISRNRLDIQPTIDGQLNTIWNNLASVENAVSEITRIIRAFLKENPQ